MQHKFILLSLSFLCFFSGLLYYGYEVGKTPVITITNGQETQNKEIKTTKFNLADYDADKNGYLSKKEAEVLLISYFRSKNDDTPESRTREEYMKNANEELKLSMVPEEKISFYRKKAEETFDRQDLNSDDVLTEAEFIEYNLNIMSKGMGGDFNGKGLPINQKAIVRMKK